MKRKVVWFLRNGIIDRVRLAASCASSVLTAIIDVTLVHGNHITCGYVWHLVNSSCPGVLSTDGRRVLVTYTFQMCRPIYHPLSIIRLSKYIVQKRGTPQGAAPSCGHSRWIALHSVSTRAEYWISRGVFPPSPVARPTRWDAETARTVLRASRGVDGSR